VPALSAEGFDVRAGGLGDPQPAEGEQRDQRMLSRGAEPGGDQQRADFVAVQGGGVRIVVAPRPTDVRGRRVVEQVFLDGEPAWSGDDGQRAGDGRADSSGSFEVAGEQLDVSAAGSESARWRPWPTP
jgi:hypothetical protein